jgi:hypothetical protein
MVDVKVYRLLTRGQEWDSQRDVCPSAGAPGEDALIVPGDLGVVGGDRGLFGNDPLVVLREAVPLRGEGFAIGADEAHRVVVATEVQPRPGKPRLEMGTGQEPNDDFVAVPALVVHSFK